MDRVAEWLRWLFGAGSQAGARRSIVARWLFLRALGAIYFSAFFSLLFQIKGLIGSKGILPAGEYLAAVVQHMGAARLWYAPTVFWASSSDAMLMAVMWVGLAASVAVVLNLWPRVSLAICFACFLSFVGCASDFASYQSDGMLLEAGFISLFFAPGGVRPGMAWARPPVRASLILLGWEWFRIYFESGMVKLQSGDRQWRTLTAMDEYYQNSPLPTWVGWYVEHLPHWFHAATAVVTLAMEFGVVLLVFAPKRVRLVGFWVVTVWQIGVILTGNYAFLNYLVLALGILLVDDAYLVRWVPVRWRAREEAPVEREAPERFVGYEGLRTLKSAVAVVMLTWVGYATVAEMVWMVMPEVPLPRAPVAVLEPFRIANQYGLFAVMTRGRYEIEFQGSNDGVTWQPYLFRNKPQVVTEWPRIYAPYQPRFDWNLWFASLGDWRQNDMVPLTEEALLENRPQVVGLFRGSPFGGVGAAGPAPKFVRAVLWQYWFTSIEEKRRTGAWWRTSLLGLYAPELTMAGEGKFAVVQPPDELAPHD